MKGVDVIQEIFEGTGVALCVLNVSGLKDAFDKAQLQNPEQLQAWLATIPQSRRQLLQECA